MIPVRSLSFAAVVLIPAALAAVYYFLIAADQYIAEFRFALRAVEPVRTEMGRIFQGNIAPSPVSVDSMPLSNTSAAVTSLKREFGRVGFISVPLVGVE